MTDYFNSFYIFGFVLNSGGVGINAELDQGVEWVGLWIWLASGVAYTAAELLKLYILVFQNQKQQKKREIDYCVLDILMAALDLSISSLYIFPQLGNKQILGISGVAIGVVGVVQTFMSVNDRKIKV